MHDARTQDLCDTNELKDKITNENINEKIPLYLDKLYI